MRYLTGRSEVGGGRSKSDRSASGRDRSPQPGPSGLGLGEWSAPGADRSRSWYRGRSSPAPSGVEEDDRDALPVWSIWIGLFFASSGSSMA